MQKTFTVDETIILFYNLWKCSVGSRHLRIIFENNSIFYDSLENYIKDTVVRPNIMNKIVVEISTLVEGLLIYIE